MNIIRSVLHAAVGGAVHLIYGSNDLHQLAFIGHTAAMRVLLAAGDNPNAVDQNGKTPLYYASQLERNIEAVRLLLDSGALVDPEDQNGETPLFVAASLANAAGVRLLLARGADVNHANHEGHTALFHARIGGTDNILIAAGADRSQSFVANMQRGIAEAFAPILELLAPQGLNQNE